MVGEQLGLLHNCKSYQRVKLMLHVMSLEIAPVRFLFSDSILSLRSLKKTTINLLRIEFPIE
jgi:hypothetical protein